MKAGIKRRLKKEPCQFDASSKGILDFGKEKMGGFYYPRSGRSDWQKSRVVRLDIGYDSLQAYLDHLQLGKQGFSFIINQKHEFVYHPKRRSIPPAKKCRPCSPILL